MDSVSKEEEKETQLEWQIEYFWALDQITSHETSVKSN